MGKIESQEVIDGEVDEAKEWRLNHASEVYKSIAEQIKAECEAEEELADKEEELEDRLEEAIQLLKNYCSCGECTGCVNAQIFIDKEDK